ncbi:APC family permease [Methanobacterium oryzae]|uniref:APC family permease n=1 Tax=Methanobacterium oryzae TaxID=69540 RepID=UPI003D22F44C
MLLKIKVLEDGGLIKSLKRKLGLFEVTISGIGIILGAGIYALLGEAAPLSGNALWLSFLISSTVAAFTALSYAELSSMFPSSAAEYEYVKNAMGERIGFIIGWIIIFSAIISSSTVAVGFGNYLGTIFNIEPIYSAIALIGLLSLLLFIGIKESAWVAILFTSIEALGLLIIFFIGIPYYGSVNYLEMPLGLNGVFASAALIFFAYLGFEEIVKLSDETIEPNKNIPKAIILAMIISTTLYILVAFSSVSILGWEALANSPAPFSQIASAALGPNGALLLSIIALFATSNTVLLLLLAGSRIVYGMAASKSLPHFLKKVHPRTRTPWVSIIAVGIIAIAFLFLGNLEFLASATNYALFLSFAFINAAVIVLRYKSPDFKRQFKIPLNIKNLPLLPVFGLITCIILLFQLSFDAIALGIFITIIGLILAFIWQK